MNISVIAFLNGAPGTGEIIVLFLVVLVMFGPKRLPELSRMIGKTLNQLRKGADDFKDQVMKIEDDDDIDVKDIFADDSEDDDEHNQDEYNYGSDDYSDDPYGADAYAADEEQDDLESSDEDKTESSDVPPEPVSDDGDEEESAKAEPSAEDEGGQAKDDLAG